MVLGEARQRERADVIITRFLRFLHFLHSSLLLDARRVGIEQQAGQEPQEGQDRYRKGPFLFALPLILLLTVELKHDRRC